MMKLKYAMFAIDEYTVHFDCDRVVVKLAGEHVGTIPNQSRHWNGRRLKPRKSDAMKAIKEVSRPTAKLLTTGERKRKRTKYTPPVQLKIAESGD